MKKIISLALIICILASTISSLAFSDIPDSQLSQKAEMLKMLGFFANADNFYPSSHLTRAQFCVIAVRVKDLNTNAASYGNYTKYPDVRSNYWGIGWVNAATSLKLLTGRPNGKFDPDAKINYAEVITVLMKTLGYSDADVGSNWPNSFINKAKAIGLTDGVNVSNSFSAYVTRAELAIMLDNLLNIKPKDGTDNYIDTLGFSKKEAVILSVSATMPDGKNQAILTSEGFFQRTGALSNELNGKRATLLLDKTNKIVAATPVNQDRAAVMVSNIYSTSIEDAYGMSFSIPLGTNVYKSDSDTSESFSDIWFNISIGETLIVYYTAAGTIDYIYRTSGSTTGKTGVLNDNRNLTELFGTTAASATIIKNGKLSSTRDLMPLDVLVYDNISNTVQACDTRFSGIYQTGTPNPLNPTKITVFGKEFTLSADATQTMPLVRLGQPITLLIAPNGNIAKVLAGSHESSTALVTSQNSSGSTMTLTYSNGFNFDVSPVYDVLYLGQLVNLTGSYKSQAIVEKKTVPTTWGTLNVSSMTLGSSQIAPYCRFFEASQIDGCMVEVDKKKLPTSIDASQVLGGIVNANGDYVQIIVKNQTYDCYSFGLIELSTAQNAAGLDENFLTSSGNSFYTNLTTHPLVNTYGGLSGYISNNVLTVSDVVRCNMYSVSRASFQGNTAININSRLVPIAEGVQVYLKSGNTYVDIQTARAYSDRFEVYTDPANNKVRMIFTE